VISLPQAGVALRIARRDALRHKARSVLVVLMVALPVLGLTTADVLARTMQLDPAQRVTREIGHATAAFQLWGGTVTQAVDADQGSSSSSSGPVLKVGTPRYAALLANARALLPPGARVIERTVNSGTVGAHRRLVSATFFGINLADPITAGIADHVSGQAPTDASEVALSPALASRLGVTVGDDVSVGSVTQKVVGLYRDPAAWNDESTWQIPTAVAPPPGQTPTYLVASAQPITWAQVLRFNAIGVAVTSRYAVLHPPRHINWSGNSRTTSEDVIGIATVAVGLAILEVVLLAGAAFAVGARRQRRDLALLAAAGGDEHHVRAVVVAGGFVLGLTGAVVGVVTGIGTARLLMSPYQRLADSQAGPFDLRPAELAAVAVLGIVTGLLASILPARAAARDDVVAALTGRRGVITTARRVPQVGLAMVVIGAFVAAYAAHPPTRFTLILVGAVISELGFVICAPALVGAVGRAARFLPLAPRMALRDAARHRGRTGPAVAAIMAAVAGSIAISTYVVSEVAQERASYQPEARVGQTLLQVYSPHSRDAAHDVAAATTVLKRELGATGLVALPTTQCGQTRCRSAQLDAADLTSADANVDNTIAIGNDAVLTALLGKTDPAAAAALNAGKLVVFAPSLVHGGRTGVAIQYENASRRVDMSAYGVAVGSASASVGAIMSPPVASRLQLSTTVSTYIVTTPKTPTQLQEDRVDAAMTQPSGWSNTGIIIGRPYHPARWGYGLLALAAAAAIVTLGATGITTGLSVAESRPDLATLVAVGSAPRTRRGIVANQAGVVALLGTATGVVSGLVPAYAILRARPGFPFVLPWDTIAVVVVAVPILAMLATATFVSPRVRLDRRAT
jgi:putative ABC transport system permease protein